MKKLQLLFFAFLIGFTAAIAPVSASIEPVHAGSIVHGSGGALLDVPYGVFVVGNYAYVTSRLN